MPNPVLFISSEERSRNCRTLSHTERADLYEYVNPQHTDYCGNDDYRKIKPVFEKHSKLSRNLYWAFNFNNFRYFSKTILTKNICPVYPLYFGFWHPARAGGLWRKPPQSGSEGTPSAHAVLTGLRGDYDYEYGWEQEHEKENEKEKEKEEEEEEEKEKEKEKEWD